MNLVVIDNYDSFSYNLVHGLAKAGATVTVFRNDATTHEHIQRLAPAGIVLSPGPGHPKNPRDVGICSQLLQNPIRVQGEPVPMLGVCLGMQAMAHEAGGVVGQAPSIVHGESSEIPTPDHPWFAGLGPTMEVARYHSLAVLDPGPWIPLCSTQDDTLMAITHPAHPWLGVQFHPESILSPQGQTMLSNFAAACHDR